MAIGSTMVEEDRSPIGAPKVSKTCSLPDLLGSSSRKAPTQVEWFMDRSRPMVCVLGPEGALKARRSVRDLDPIQVAHKQQAPRSSQLSMSSFAGDHWPKSPTHESLTLSPMLTFGGSKTRYMPHSSGTPVWSRRSRRAASVGNLGSMAVAPMRFETRDMRERRIISPREESGQLARSSQDEGKEGNVKSIGRQRSSHGTEALSNRGEAKSPKRVRVPEAELDVDNAESTCPAVLDLKLEGETDEARVSTQTKDWHSYRFEGGRSVKEVIDRCSGFSGAEIARVHQAFVRFSPPDMFELDRDALQDICLHLGYYGVADKILHEIASQVSDFSTYNLEEVVDILEKYSVQERDVFTHTFSNHLAEGSDVLDLTEVAEALRSVGITMTATALNEMLSLLRINRPVVRLAEFIDLMVILCASEGFKQEDIKSARRVFDDYSLIGAGSPKEAIMKLNSLVDALLHFLGPSSMQFVKEGVVRKLSLSGRVETPDSKSRDITFHEFMIWARRIRELTYDATWQVFETATLDSEEEGVVSREELNVVLQDLGFTLFDDAFDEFCSEAGVEESTRMNFDAVVAFVKICHVSAGFRKKDVAEFEEVFNHFDYDKSGQIENVELLDLLRYLGYNTSLEDVHRFLNQADANANGAMDFHEFLRQMRLLREDELTQSRAVFESMWEKSSEQLNVAKFGDALKALDQVPGQMLLEDVLKEAGSPEAFDFKQFVDATDRCRKLKAQRRRARAGFSDEEYNYMRPLFEKRCKPGSKELEKGELLWFLIDFDVHVSSLEERQKLFERLETARLKAIEAGVEDAEAGKAASPTTFHVFLHFLQAWRCEEQQIKLNEEEKVMDKSRFSLAEVEEFRILFMQWVKKSGRLDDEEEETTTTTTQGLAAQPSITRRSSLPNISAPGAEPPVNVLTPATTAVTTSDPKAVLSMKNLQLLLASIGLQLSNDQRMELDGKLRQILDGNKLIDFGAFLLLMRWMLDTNFADINGASKKALERTKQSHPTSPNASESTSSPSRRCARRKSV